MSATENNLFQIGDVLDDKWVIIEFIGKGAMGEVYRAHQLKLDRDVAIKVISEEAMLAAEDDPDEIDIVSKRFHREVQAMAKVRHTNILNIYDYGSLDSKADNGGLIEYIAMEYIPGNTLRFTMSDYGVDDEPSLYSDWIQAYFLPILDGVEAIHSHKIVHRDLKPENIFVDGGTPKIADFGLARSHAMEGLTSSVTMLGTLAYMSPEQCTDFKNSDYTADIYALGKILFEAASGKLTEKTIPFKSVTLKDPETPFMKEVALIIEKATEEDKKDRYESVSELRSSLKKALALHLKGESQIIQDVPASALHRYFPDKLTRIGSLLAIVSVAAMIIWHFMDKPDVNFENKRTTLDSSQEEFNLSSGNMDNSQDPGTIAKSIVSEHIGKQQFIPKGQLLLPKTLESVAGNKVEIDAFYIDEFLVTNQQFVDFLNHNLSRITLVNGIVMGDGANWYLLGEIYEGFEPIVYRDMEFHITDPGFASSPVLRVTGYGAAAFANSVNRRLPTELEWLYVTLGDPAIQPPTEDTNDNRSTMDMGNMMNNGGGWGWQQEGWYLAQDRSKENGSERTPPPAPHEPPSAAFYQKNSYNVRALNKGIGEWGIRSVSKSTENHLQENAFLVMGGIDAQVKTDRSAPHMISRFPWEGFEEVSFRTVASARN